MAWFKKVRKPIEASPDKSRVPEGLWVKCPSCGQVIYNKDLAASLSVCTKCAYHFRLSASERLRTLFEQFPDALAMLVRAVRVGIPITGGMRSVASASSSFAARWSATPERRV